MASSFDFGYGNPSNFSDWASYAGFDRKTGQLEPPAPDTGVAPPETFGELFQQKAVDPFNRAVGKAQQFGSNLSSAVGQFGQGNGMGAVNAMQGKKPVMPGQQPIGVQQTQEQSDWGFQSHID